jgi:hypothetical protein
MVALLLALCVVLAGLWSGLLLTLTTLLHPMFRAADGPAFAGLLHGFLPVARRSPTNYVIILGLVVVPGAALAAMWSDRGSAPFVLTAIGYVACLVGPVAISRAFAEPNYDVMLGWDPTALPANWPDVRRYYFRLNWIRGAFIWVAFAMFLIALCARLSGR